jgi:hypothetical protein
MLSELEEVDSSTTHSRHVLNVPSISFGEVFGYVVVSYANL